MPEVYPSASILGLMHYEDILQVKSFYLHWLKDSKGSIAEQSNSQPDGGSPLQRGNLHSAPCKYPVLLSLQQLTDFPVLEL